MPYRADASGILEERMKTVAETLEGKTLLITGATGFLGQPLVEKILWLAPRVRRLYVLIRAKRQLGGQVLTAEDRLKKELFQSAVFDRLDSRYREETQSFLAGKVIAIAGDVSESGLGLDSEVRQRLLTEVDIVINSAAVVSFDAPLEDALQLNALSPERVAEFVNECKNALLVHVSTAYVSGAHQPVAPETIYHSASPAEASELYPLGKFTDVEREVEYLKDLIQRIRSEAEGEEVDRQLKTALLKRFRKSGRGGRKTRRREKIENLRRKWIANRLVKEGLLWARKRGWNDTYTYTKALGEQLLLRKRQTEAPTVIVRPSVIESSLAEPSPGWLDGLRMADPLIIAIGKGRLRSLPMNPKVTLDLVPVDMVVNALLASIPAAEGQSGVQVYHVATGERNPISLGELHDLLHSYFTKNPMLDKAGNPIVIKRFRFHNPAAFRLQHKLKTIPLSATERALKNLSVSESSQSVIRKISARKVAFEKLYYYGKIYQPYLNLNCCFQINNTLRLFNSLSTEEKKLLNFDVTRLNWRHYIQNVHIPGVKKYILKLEGVGSLELNQVPREQLLKTPTIPDLLEASAAKFPRKTALQIKRDSVWERITYQELRDAARRIGMNFRTWGFEKGARVVIYSENQPEWGMAYLGAVTTGLVVVPLDAQTWHKEVWEVARLTEACALLASGSCFRKLQEEDLRENEERDTPLRIFNVDKHCAPFKKEEYPRSTHVEAHPRVQPQPDVDPEDLASIIFTNSTAVDPKGVMHTHRNFITNLLGVNHHLPIETSDQVLSVLPLYHTLEFTCGFLLPLYGGATISYVHSLKPRVILSTMQQVGTTCMLGVPTLYALIREDIERRVLRAANSRGRFNLLATSKRLARSVGRKWGRSIGQRLFARVHQEFGGRVRFFVSGGSGLGDELYEDFRALGIPIYEGYGLTETAPVLTVNPLRRSRKGSAGRPLPGVELRVFHPDRDGVGEIIARTPCLMKGYYKNPQATEAVIRDGWFHTGDLGWVDADGYVYVTGRVKEVIVTGAGKNVYPADLEAFYSGIRGVNEVCVVGIKNGLTEDIHAVFNVDLGALGARNLSDARKLILRQVQGMARELPSYHRLQQVHAWTQALPRNESGEMCREEVRSALGKRVRLEQPPRISAAASRAPAANNEEPALLDELSRLSGLPEAEIGPESHLYLDLGLDSLMAIELLLFIEDRFGLQIEDQLAARLETVQQLTSAVRSARALRRKTGSDKAQNRAKADAAVLATNQSALGRSLQGFSLSGLKALYRSYFGLRLHGKDHLPVAGPYIIASNHSSHLDAPAILSAVGSALGLSQARRLRVLGAKDYFFDTRVKGWLFSTFLNLVPVEREETALAGLRMVKRLLAAGEPILIFPEGTRSRTGEIQHFKPGLGLIAIEAGVPIVPVYIKGTHEAMPAGAFFPRPQRVEVIFAPPILMDRYRSDDSNDSRDSLYRDIASDVQKVIERMASASMKV